MKKYETKVTSIGDLVEELLQQKILILFDKNAPVELQEMSVVHTGGTLEKEIASGDLVILGNSTYTITAVGEVANQNLRNIGHVCLKFNALTSPELPGDVHLQGNRVPLVAEGDIIAIKDN